MASSSSPPTRPGWSPRFRECLGCGDDVPPHIGRMLGDENGNVIACPTCVDGRGSSIDSYQNAIERELSAHMGGRNA
jgi:hypothetical protein